MVGLALGLALGSCTSPEPLPPPSPGSDGVLTEGPLFPMEGLLQTASVQTDRQGVPHVLCRNALDCVQVYGFVQARERFFQMDLRRRTARGTLAELRGEEALASDRFYRAVFQSPRGKSVHQEILELLPPSELLVLESFARGVNQWLAAARQSPETFPLQAGYASLPAPPRLEDLEEWQPLDSVAVMRLFTWEQSGGLGQELELGKLHARLPPGVVTELVRLGPAEASYTVPDAPGFNRQGPAGPAPGVAASATRLAATGDLLFRLDALGLPPAVRPGGTCALVAGSRSATGQPLMACDSHGPLEATPAFHLVHLAAAGTGLEALGAALPGLPHVWMGRNPRVAWGLSPSLLDVVDLYTETLAQSGDAVRFQGREVLLLQSFQVIRVRTPDGATPFREVPLTIKVVPHHGPLLPGTEDGRTALSLRWTGHEPSYEPAALWALAQVRTAAQGKEALSRYQAGPVDILLADDLGGLAHAVPSALPTRSGDLRQYPPWLPLPGSGETEWSGLVPGPDLPQVSDFRSGFAVAANADPAGATADGDPLNDRLYQGAGFDPGFRHRRLAELLAAKEKLNLEDLVAAQGDTRSLLGGRLRALLQQAASARADLVAKHQLQDALALLKDWSLDCPTGLAGPRSDSGLDPDAARARDSAACALFHSTWSQLTRALFADELKASGARLDEALRVRAVLHLYEEPLSPSGALVVDDPATAAVESREEVLLLALREGAGALATALGTSREGWRWGRVHTGLLAGPGPLALPGGLFTLNAGDLTAGGLGAGLASVLRMAHELTQPPRLLLGLAGERPEQVEAWLANRPFEGPMTQLGIEAVRERGENFLPVR